MTDAREVLVIRADADTRMGTGHVMRCVALAQAWEERGGRAQFVCSTVTPSLEARLRGEGFSVTSLPESAGSLADAAATVDVARHAGASWIVVDGYHFDVAYHRAIKTAGLRLLILDDYGHTDHYLADLVLNQNVHAEPSLYRDREPHTRLLLGTRYAMLRREFWASRLWRRSIPPVARRLLVTLGGSDPDNVTRTLIEAIAGLNVDGLQTTVLVGGSNPHQASLDASARDSSRPIRIERNVSDMPPWMQWADAAVTAAGGTLWELAFFALPSLTVILADNQEPAARWLADRGVFPTLGRGTSVSAETVREPLCRLLGDGELRRKHSERAAALVDGNGVFRVVEAMTE
jgi:UDP-2,4-diacetamido-2,4,6-trideoxy-beta-L-altropyranose hydrolase